MFYEEGDSMKIYPGTHQIYNVDSVNSDEDIVLGYLDSEFIEETITINVNDEQDQEINKSIFPYETFDSLEMTFYDDCGNPISTEEQEKILTREQAGKYTYVPKAHSTFNPYMFSYSVLAKKNMKYSSNRKYNLKVGCSDVSMAKSLIQYFSDSNERGMCPTNIKFNNGDKKLESLFNSTTEYNDFIFITSADGKHIGDEETLEKRVIPIEEYMNKNVVPWIVCESMPDEEVPDYAENKVLSFELKENKTVNTDPFISSYYFKYPKAEDGVIYHKVFRYRDEESPIVIKEYVNKGFVVYCNSEFMTRLSDSSNVFYELMMYIYLRAYISTEQITEWITNEMPDYVIQNGRCIQKEKFKSDMELHKLLGLLDGDVIPVDVKINQPDPDGNTVCYTGMSKSYLVFKKSENLEYADPIKEEGQISIFTARKNVMFCDSIIYEIQESIKEKISCRIEDDILYVTVQPFKNTRLNTRHFVNTAVASIELDYSLFSQNVSLVWNRNRNTVELLNLELLDEHVLLADIKVLKEKKESKLYDMRQRGGGIPESSVENFECLDIGNISGRPYRKGGALITTVRLPMKYEYRESELYEIIYGSIRTHMVADDFLVLNLVFI